MCLRNLLLSFLLFFTPYIYATDTKEDTNTTVYIQEIAVEGNISKDDIQAINTMIQEYQNRNLTLTNIEQLKNRLSSYYKNRGFLFTKVLLPAQDISDGKLKFSIVKTKVEDINITGNKYYSTDFIRRNFHFKSGDYLDYQEMVEDLLFLNSYEDLSVKSYLKKGSKFGTTDVHLAVRDSRPFHGTLTYDNLGSKDTAKERLSADISYGNLINDGDNISVHTTFGLKSLSSDSTKLVVGNYETTTIGPYFTRLNLSYLYADYITAGDLSVLELKGDTKIYTVGIKQPLLYTPTKELSLSCNYYQKDIKSYLLGDISSQDLLDILELKTEVKYRRAFDAFELSVGVAKGINGDDSLSSRYGADIKFAKALLRASYNRYINDFNSLLLNIDSQYSQNRVPLSELFTIGGLSSVRAYEPAQKLGDSGFVVNAEWFLHPKTDYHPWLKNALQIGFFMDYGRIFNNQPVPGEEKASALAAAGGEILVNINKRLFARVSVGYPLYETDKLIDDYTHLYGYVGIKLW